MKAKYIIPTLLLATSLYTSAQTKNKEEVKQRTKTELVKGVQTKQNSEKSSFRELFAPENSKGDTGKIIKICTKILLQEINKERAKYALAPLQEDQQLTEVCQRYANLMRDTKKRGHAIDGKTSNDMGIDLEKEYPILLENISTDYGLGNIEDMVQDWLYLDERQDKVTNKKRTGPTHSNPILNKYIDKYGAGFGVTKQGRIYVIMISATKDKEKVQKYQRAIVDELKNANN